MAQEVTEYDRRTPKAVLKHMLETGEWSDLKIKTPTHTFNVHKSVVCPACPFLHAACTRGWKECQSGIIELPEEKKTIEVLLLYLYGQLGPETEVMNYYDGVLWDQMLGYLAVAGEVIMAADKYQLRGLFEWVERCIPTWLDMCAWDEVLDPALRFYQLEPRDIVGPKILNAMVKRVACDIEYISRDVNDWLKMSSCPDLTRDVMRYVARHSDVVDHDEYAEDLISGERMVKGGDDGVTVSFEVQEE